MMRKTKSNSLKSFDNGFDKVKAFKTEKKTIFNYLKRNVATASMVCKATGVPQKNFTRYKRDLENLGLLFEVYKGVCEVTGFKAWYLTTSKDLDVRDNQCKIQF